MDFRSIKTSVFCTSSIARALHLSDEDVVITGVRGVKAATTTTTTGQQSGLEPALMTVGTVRLHYIVKVDLSSPEEADEGLVRTAHALQEVFVRPDGGGDSAFHTALRQAVKDKGRGRGSGAGALADAVDALTVEVFTSLTRHYYY